VLAPPLVDPVHPDLTAVRRLVADALATAPAAQRSGVTHSAPDVGSVC